MAESILILDDDADIRTLLARFLGKQGYDVETAGRGAQAKEMLTKGAFDLVLCDHRLPDTDSIEMLQFIRTRSQRTAVIIITGYSDVRMAVDLMRKGAFDYVGKPLYPDEILMRVKEALAQRNEVVDVEVATSGKNNAPPRSASAVQQQYVHGLGSYSTALSDQIKLVAPTSMTVLITGETGTGKEYVAKELHRSSNRADKPFVAVDCGALPKDLAGSELFGHVKGAFTGALSDKRGSFEQAHGGTLFLDEIGNLTYENQVKLLRVLQERRIKRIGDEKDIEVDVRVLAATNENLLSAVADNRFREDLYHRVNEFYISLLPLRERQDDIATFAEHFLRKANEQLGKEVEGFEPGVLERLQRHAWPGNLRELGNVVKRAVLLTPGAWVPMQALPAEIISGHLLTQVPQPMVESASDGLRGISHSAEKQAILKALERNGFNKSRTAESLNIDRKTLYNKLKAFGIDI